MKLHCLILACFVTKLTFSDTNLVNKIYGVDVDVSELQWTRRVKQQLGTTAKQFKARGEQQDWSKEENPFDALQMDRYNEDAANFMEKFALGKEPGTFYDTNFRPNYRGKPVHVFCSAYIGSISSVSEENMDFTLDFYFRQSWLDYRLAFNESLIEGDEDERGAKVINIPADFMHYIWRPSTYFVNGKWSAYHHVTRHNGFIRIRPSGVVLQSMRITVTARCVSWHFNFPAPSYSLFFYIYLDNGLSIFSTGSSKMHFGKQVLIEIQVHFYYLFRSFVSVESYSLPANDLLYIWTASNVALLDKIEIEKMLTQSRSAFEKSISVGFHPNVSSLPHLSIIGYSASEKFAITHDGQNHSKLLLNIFFARSLGYYVIQVYLPASLMVVVSWISFWISRTSAPARITLSVTTVLTVVTITLQSYHSTLPKLSYLKGKSGCKLSTIAIK